MFATGAIERQAMGTDGPITWYHISYQPNFWCRIGRHLPTQLRCEGPVGLLSVVRRLRCPCGQRDWVEYDGSLVEKSQVQPGDDERAAEQHVAIERLRKDEKERIARHIPDCYGVPGNCQSCGCDKQGRFGADGIPSSCVSHRVFA